MTVYDIVFSPTGGTKKVSDLFTKAFCGQNGMSSPIDLADRSKDFSTFSLPPLA